MRFTKSLKQDWLNLIIFNWDAVGNYEDDTKKKRHRLQMGQ